MRRDPAASFDHFPGNLRVPAFIRLVERPAAKQKHKREQRQRGHPPLPARRVSNGGHGWNSLSTAKGHKSGASKIIEAFACPLTKKYGAVLFFQFVFVRRFRVGPNTPMLCF